MRRGAETLKEAADEELLARCMQGEADAWDALIDRYAALIYSIPLKYGLSEPDAADVFQAVCLTLIEKLHTIRTPRGLPAWIITTTSRQSLSVAQSRRREQRRSASSVVATHENLLADPDLLPEEELLALERQRIVRAAVSKLPANCRGVIDALFTDGALSTSYQQLADQLGMPMNSVGPTRARCLERLRRALVSAGYTL